MCGGVLGPEGAIDTYLRKQYLEPHAAKQKATIGVGGVNKPSVKGKAEGKVEGRRQTGPSASGFKGTDKRGDLVSGDRKKSVDKKTLLGG